MDTVNGSDCFTAQVNRRDYLLEFSVVSEPIEGLFFVFPSSSQPKKHKKQQKMKNYCSFHFFVILIPSK